MWKAHRIGKEEIKLPFFTNGIDRIIENPSECTYKSLD
jgi:hypothetical protein